MVSIRDCQYEFIWTAFPARAEKGSGVDLGRKEVVGRKGVGAEKGSGVDLGSKLTPVLFVPLAPLRESVWQCFLMCRKFDSRPSKSPVPLEFRFPPPSLGAGQLAVPGLEFGIVPELLQHGHPGHDLRGQLGPKRGILGARRRIGQSGKLPPPLARQVSPRPDRAEPLSQMGQAGARRDSKRHVGCVIGTTFSESV